MSLPAPVSVLVSSFNEGDRLAATVRSLVEARTVPCEIVVVDDGSTDRPGDRQWPEQVRVLRQDHRGIASARNLAARQATQPIVIFLDAHCTVDPSWITPLVDALDASPDAIVGPAVRDGRDTHFAGCGATVVDPLFTYRWLPVAGPGIREVGIVPGGCLAVRRDLFLEGGGFGAFREFGLEDVELALRWWRHGRPLLGVPASRITHRFRTRPPYPADHQAWTENVLRTALLHLPPHELRLSIAACSRFADFGTAIAAVLGEPWIEQHQHLARVQSRTAAAYLSSWAPSAFADGSVPRDVPPGPP